MSLPVELIEAEALGLPPMERARLARVLLMSLDDDGEDPVDVDRAWEAEIRERLADYRAGIVTPVPAEVVFRHARTRLME